MRDKPVQDGPIFIIGNPRSGTTMLRLMLASHPHIGVPPESGWLIVLYDKYAHLVFSNTTIELFVDDLLAVPKIEEWCLDRTDLLEDLRLVCPADYKVISSRVYHHYTKRHGNKRRWGDKNNFYLDHIDKLDDLFPEATFLHIVRDGRDVACSYRDLSQTKGLYAPELPSSVCGAALHWKKNLARIQKSLAHTKSERVLTVRYEDLVQDPEEILQGICTFLGEDFDTRMLAFAEINRREKLEPDVFMGWKALTKQPVTTVRSGRWKQEMFQEDLFLFEFLTKGMLLTYEYEPSDLSTPTFSGLFLRGYALIRLGGWYGQALLRKVRRSLRLFPTY